MYQSIGIDLGTSKVILGAASEGTPSALELIDPLRGEDGTFLGIGEDNDCRANQGNGGVILPNDSRERAVVSEHTQAILSHAVARYAGQAPARLLLSIPCSFTEVEENALAEMAVNAGAAEVYLVYAPIAALAGNDLDLSTPAVVVDIGTRRTNMLAACRGRIIYKKTYPVGGKTFDEAIAAYLLHKHKVRVELDTAEAVKLEVGTVWVGNEKRTVEVHGRDVTNGDYCTVRISSEEMFTALEEPMAALIEGVCETITKIPADCVQEVFDTGILLSGGGCLLEGIDRMISGVTGVNASRLSAPKETVAKGLAALLTAMKTLHAAGTRNISRYIMKMSAKPRRGA